MPFPEQTSRAFTQEGVDWLNLRQIGVYGLFNTDQWVYIGQAVDLRRRLHEHLNGDNACINRYRPSNYVAVLCSRLELDERERTLILECQPACNQQLP